MRIRFHILPRLKIVFCAVPKSASTAVRNALLEAEGRSHPRPSVAWASGGPEYVLDLREKGWLLFTVVRNPYDRVASAYKQKVVGDKIPKIMKSQGITTKTSFDEFVRWCYKTPDDKIERHCRSMCADLYHKGELVPSLVLRHENLDKDWERLREVSGLDLPDLKRHNVSPEKKIIWDVQLRSLVSVRYNNDFKAFDYEVLT